MPARFGSTFRTQQRGWRLKVKVAIDRTLGAVGLIVTAPAMIATAIAIRSTMGSPVLFFQERVGRGGELFRLVKFKTMNEARSADGQLMQDEQRLTRLGRFLRATSLDELPQLWNVLGGKLSLVGPRPLLVRYLPRYTTDQARRHEVLPGITGWAQVNGRNTISWEQKFALDVWYVDHWSLGLDARVLAMTIAKVLRREGVSAVGQATMPEFEGRPGPARDGEGRSTSG
jgi:lipopolysaccharide/colanic/teichoic acid biosynthesis glycosyltransferase